MICKADCCAYSSQFAVWPAAGKFGWRPGWLVGQRLAGRVGASAGCAPTAWLAKRLLAAWPALGCHSEQHSTEWRIKTKHVFHLAGQLFTAGISHRWQSTLGINKQEKRKHNCTTILKQEHKNRNTIVRPFSKQGGSHHRLAMYPAGL